MAWTIKKRDERTYERNPLASVICQLRFHPILKVADGISDFQEKVRETFPDFSKNMASVLSLQTPAGGIEVQHEQQFLFKKADGSSTLTLTTGSLSLENHVHIDRTEFFKAVQKSVEALEALYAPISPLRLGLRYINILRKDDLAEQLKRKVDWPEVIAAPFLATPTGLADLQDTTFVTEMRGPVTGAEGALTLRHGLVNDNEGKASYRFDMDRYFDGPFALGTVKSKLDQAGDDIFSLFCESMGPALTEWMSKKNLLGAN